MRVIKPSYEILTPINRVEILKSIELAARCCYKSEDHITEDSAAKLVKMLIDRNHMAMIEHYSLSIKFICNRGVSHEIVRHRIASFGQESTRYVNYSRGKFGSEITVIKPLFYEEGTENYNLWYESMLQSEKTYMQLISNGSTAQEARDVLPNALKTEIVMTANLREWIHFFTLRTASVAHPAMTEITRPALEELKQLLPEIFCHIEVK